MIVFIKKIMSQVASPPSFPISSQRNASKKVWLSLNDEEAVAPPANVALAVDVASSGEPLLHKQDLKDDANRFVGLLKAEEEKEG